MRTQSQNADEMLARALAVLLAVTAFLFDIFSPEGIAIGVFYALMVLSSLWFPRPGMPFILGAAGTVLIGLGYWLSPGGGEYGNYTIIVINRLLDVLIVWITALICFWRNLANTHLHDEQHRLRAIIDTAPVAVITIDERGIVRSFSPMGEELFGYRADDVVGRNVSLLMPSPYREEHDSYLAHYRDTGQKRIIGIGRNVDARRKDGTVFPIHLSVGEVFLEDKRLFTGFIQDLSPLVAAQRAATKELEFTSAILESTDALVAVLDTEGHIVRFNPACERLTGHTAAEMVGKPAWSLIPPEQQDEVRTVFDALIGGLATNRFENDWLTKAGGRRRIYWSNAVLTDKTGTIRNVLATGLDITERRRDEKQIEDLHLELYQIGRVSELGAMAAAIAHELNQPLSAVVNYTQASLNLLKPQTGDIFSKPREYMAKAIEQAERAGEIVRRLRRLIGHHEATLELCNLNELVREASALALLGAKEKGIAARLSLRPGLPPVLVDGTQIQQVVLNLVRNSIEALEDSARREIVIGSAPREDTEVEVSIADTGPGLDKAVAENLFQPFMTTKSSGMGVGLSICRSIIEAHSGRIWVEPNPGGGTVFRFCLPVARAEEEEKEEEGGEPRVR